MTGRKENFMTRNYEELTNANELTMDLIENGDIHQKALFLLRKSQLEFLQEFLWLYYYDEKEDFWYTKAKELLDQCEMAKVGDCDYILNFISSFYNRAVYCFKNNVSPWDVYFFED